MIILSQLKIIIWETRKKLKRQCSKWHPKARQKPKLAPEKLLLTVFFLHVFILQASAAVTTIDIFEELPEQKAPPKGWLEKIQQTRKGLEENQGVIFASLFNSQQQIILHSKRDEGTSRNLWYYNLEIEKQLWKGASAFIEFEVDKNKGVDKFLPTFSLFNDNGGENAGLYIPVLYLQQNFFQDKFYAYAGKLDLSYWFDFNEAAGSADTQFQSSALVNNLTIPFPAKGMGAMFGMQPWEWLYFQSGVATARASSTKIGLSDAFNSQLYLNELGFIPKIKELKGNYRFAFWLNHEKIGTIDESEEKDNDSGFALSFDQQITKKLTLFCRYGLANQKVRDIAHFWSFGGQYTTSFGMCKKDYFGLGVAQSLISNDYRDFNGPQVAPSETMAEAYYCWVFNDYVMLTPNLQAVINPDADKEADNILVLGVRFLAVF
ncbi:MAG: carbohydrate porin [Candidatus Omnitrophica bacterium]|nr:carbohydrate porin [Candidatus Omnitrophota bacterium]